MSRYIDADVLERALMFSKNAYNTLDEDELHFVISQMDETPTVEMPSWTDALAELHERFDALEKELRKASAEMSAVIREYVDRPQGEWVSEGRVYPPTNAYNSAYCSHCGEWSEYLTDYCGNCGADMRERKENE